MPRQQNFQQQRTQQRMPMSAAPVSRSASPTISRSNGSISITLNAAQREAAEIAGMSDEEYAAELVRLNNLGKIVL